MQRLPLALLATTLAATGLLVLTGVPASAVVSGPNGLIAFQSDRDGDPEIFVSLPDGSGLTQLTSNSVYDADPAWSPDGSKIVFVRQSNSGPCTTNSCRNVWVMNADGTGKTQLTIEPDGTNDSSPTWSPDGSRIAFARRPLVGDKDVWSMSADGSGQVQLTQDPADDFAPDWSPDGSAIVFVSTRTTASQLFIMSPDGSGQSQIVLAGSPPSALVGEPSWSPDGTQIAFRGATATYGQPTQLYLTGADGTNTHTIYAPGTFVYAPAWSPDGSRIALSDDLGGAVGFELELLDPTGGTASGLNSSAGADTNPSWGTNQTVPQPPPPPSGVHVSVSDNVYQPATPTASIGTDVVWDFSGPSDHTATDNTGMGLYDSGVKGPGTSLTYNFSAAGAYAFICRLHSGMSGTVQVSIEASPSSGSRTTAFTLTWAGQQAPAGFAYDVQILRPGAKSWRLWKSGVASPSASFTPDKGTGTYRFRARLYKSKKAHAAYSDPVSITVG